MKTIKALLIDSKNGAIKEVTLNQVDGSFLADMYKLLDCRLVDVIHNSIDGSDNDIWIDDEGATEEAESFFLPTHQDYTDAQYWIAGNGLITGHDLETGETTSHTLTQKDVKKLCATMKIIRKNHLPKIDDD